MDKMRSFLSTTSTNATTTSASSKNPFAVKSDQEKTTGRMNLTEFLSSKKTTETTTNSTNSLFDRLKSGLDNNKNEKTAKNNSTGLFGLNIATDSKKKPPTSAILSGTPFNSNATGLEEMASCCPKMTKTQRLYGFAACFSLGYLISFMASLALIGGSKNGAKFGIMYSLGNIVALSGSAFLVGPATQMKLMFKPVRRVAAMVYLSTIALVLILAFAAPHLGFIILMLALVQFIAAVWYTASYVPFGRKIIKKILAQICGTTESSESGSVV